MVKWPTLFLPLITQLSLEALRRPELLHMTSDDHEHDEMIPFMFLTGSALLSFVYNKFRVQKVEDYISFFVTLCPQCVGKNRVTDTSLK